MEKIAQVTKEAGSPEFGAICQRLLPSKDVTAVGIMACWLPADSSTTEDCHTQSEVVLVTTGTGVVEADGVVVKITQGDVVYLAPSEVHTVRATTDLAWTSVYWPGVEA